MEDWFVLYVAAGDQGGYSLIQVEAENVVRRERRDEGNHIGLESRRAVQSGPPGDRCNENNKRIGRKYHRVEGWRHIYSVRRRWQFIIQVIC